jgi:hypothetical protein
MQDKEDMAAWVKPGRIIPRRAVDPMARDTSVFSATLLGLFH